MTRRMLINAQRKEELRIAIIDNDILEEYQVEVAERGLTVGNIYRGTVANVQPGLNAAFIDYGAERHGFLSIQDVVSEAFHKPQKDGDRRPRIEEVLERGQPILVQVEKDPQGQKGAAVTTNISLAGRYLVLMPFSSTVGVSRKVEDDDIRRKLRDRAAKLQLPPGCGVIVRTNALDQNQKALSRDVNALLRVWRRVSKEGGTGRGAKLVYHDQNLILKALRDYLDSSVAEVLVDDEAAHAETMEYMRAFMPRSKTRVVLYTDRVPLFSQYRLEPQLDRIYDRQVDLKGGGSIVIDRTEALTAIDVNSGRGSGRSTQEETALQTNLEAAKEVARQLRLRDIGGLFVVDFIDMRSQKNRRRLERDLKEALKADKARSTVGRISGNGLLEINRQRIRQELRLRTHAGCPTCRGTGRIASAEMVGLNLLRRIQARAASGSIGGVRIRLHPEVADVFQNGRRREIAGLEDEFGIHVEVLASGRLHLPDLEIEWLNPEVREPTLVLTPPSTIVEAALLTLPELPSSETESTGEKKSSRRPRRRRRGRRRSANAEKSNGDGQESQPAESGAEGGAGNDAGPAERPTTDGSAADKPGGEDAAAEPGPTRRRRPARRRSPRKPKTVPVTSAAEPFPGATDSASATDSGSAATGTSAAESGTAKPARPGRRRPRSRSRRKPAAQESPETP